MAQNAGTRLGHHTQRKIPSSFMMSLLVQRVMPAPSISAVLDPPRESQRDTSSL